MSPKTKGSSRTFLRQKYLQRYCSQAGADKLNHPVSVKTHRSNSAVCFCTWICRTSGVGWSPVHEIPGRLGKSSKIKAEATSQVRVNPKSRLPESVREHRQYY